MFTAGVPLWDVEEAHISLIDLATVRSIQAAIGAELNPLHFRANIYLDGIEPWAELNWVGRQLHLGDAEVEVFGSTERCKATSIRPSATR
jgi:hypothetical protein